MSEFELRFGGIERLVGKKQSQILAEAHVLVVGLGGVGSWVVEALGRSGIGQISLMDFEDICVSNTNRQIHALDGNIGQLKTKALKDRLEKINPNIKIQIFDEDFNESNASRILSQGFDAVIDSVDEFVAKKALVVECVKRNIPIHLAGAAGGRLDPTKIFYADLSQTKEDSLLSHVRKRLRQKHGFPRKGSMGVPCVYSMEKPRFLSSSGDIHFEKPENFKKPLDCQTGYGTASFVTGTFGFFLVYGTIQTLLKKSSSS